MTEYEAFIREAAKRRGISPDIAVKVAKSEGGVSEPAVLAKFATGWSWWAFQLHYGGAEYPQFGTEAGQGNGFTKLTGWQPGDPAAWRDSVRYALNRAKASGWGAWYGAAAVGVGRWDGIDRNHPWDAHAETWDFETRGATVGAQLRVTEDRVRLRERPDIQAPILYEARAGELVTPLTDHAWRQVRANGRDGWMAAEYLELVPENSDKFQETPKLHFDPSTPTELQRQDFSCSIRSATWVLKSLGVDIDAGTLEDEMVPSIVSRDLGLLDARGYGLAETFKRHLDQQWHGRIRVYESLTWDDMQWRATGGPMALGGRGWNHWTAVRGINADGSINLANPAPGWKGIDQRLTRADWDRLGPWSGVLVDATPAP